MLGASRFLRFGNYLIIYMSRIGKKGAVIPIGTTVSQNGTILDIIGPLGKLSRDFNGPVEIKIGDKMIAFSPKNNSREAKALWGTYASHVVNMIAGVNKTFEKKLIIEGVGYQVEQQGSTLIFSIGFSHKVPIETPADVKVNIEKNTIILSSINKESLGQFAAQIRSKKKPEPYKGKGIRYSTEVVRRKQGKKSA